MVASISSTAPLQDRSHPSRRLSRVASLGLAALAVGLFAGNAAAALETNLTATDSGRTISVAKGAAITIDLESNASTGYHWVEATKPDPAVVAEDATSGDYVAPDSTLLGAPGKQIFRYHAAGDGRTQIVLDYVAPGTNEVGKSFNISIAVGPAAGMLDAAPVTPPATSTDSGPSSWLAVAALLGLLLVGSTLTLARRFNR